MNKRIASLLLAVAMIASLGIMAMAVDQKLVNPTGAAKTYTDVPATYHFYTEIQNVTRAGLFQGTTDTTFSPYAYMSRGQFVMVLARLEGIAGNGGVAQEGRVTDTVFTDVANTYRFAAAIKWATDNSIVNGYTETATDGTSIRTFRPRDAISRAQIAAMLHRYMEYKKYTLKEVASIPAQFTDYETQVTLADGTISTACPQTFRSDLDYGRRYGLIRGYSDGTYRPNIPVGRAQVAAMLDRIVINVTPSGRSGGGGGGGGGGSTAYSLMLTEATLTSAFGDAKFYRVNGSTWTELGGVDDKDALAYGTIVGVRVTPNAGYALDSIRVMEANRVYNSETRVYDLVATDKEAVSVTMDTSNPNQGTFAMPNRAVVIVVSYKAAGNTPSSDGTPSDGNLPVSQYKITLRGFFSEQTLDNDVTSLTGSDGFGDALKALNDYVGRGDYAKLNKDASSKTNNGSFFETVLFGNAGHELNESEVVSIENKSVADKIMNMEAVQEAIAAKGVSTDSVQIVPNGKVLLTMNLTQDEASTDTNVIWNKVEVTGTFRDNSGNQETVTKEVTFEKLMDVVDGRNDDFGGLTGRIARNLNRTFGLNLSGTDAAVTALASTSGSGFVGLDNSPNVSLDGAPFITVNKAQKTLKINMDPTGWFDTTNNHFENLVDATYEMIDAIKGDVSASSIQNAGKLKLGTGTTYAEVANFIQNVALTDNMDQVWADLGRTENGSFSFTWESALGGTYQSLLKVFAESPETGVGLTLTIERTEKN